MMVKKRILLVEDNLELLENTAEILELSNFEVIVANSGKKAQLLLLEFHPDLILCDITMPGKDGYDVLRWVRASEKNANIPFVFLTAKSEKKDIAMGLHQGADAFVTKPYNSDELIEIINNLLKEDQLLGQT